jgi:hypothetical protein
VLRIISPDEIARALSGLDAAITPAAGSLLRRTAVVA